MVMLTEPTGDSKASNGINSQANHDVPMGSLQPLLSKDAPDSSHNKEQDNASPQSDKGESPPPPYGDVCLAQNIPYRHNMPVEAQIQSDSSSTSGSGINHSHRILSVSDSSRSNTTSPNGSSGHSDNLNAKVSIATTEFGTSERQTSNRNFLTPSPHTQSHPDLPLRSTASTPSGPGYYHTSQKMSDTLPRGGNLQASISAGHIPMRRHSSNISQTITTKDSSGNTILCTEV